MKNIFIILVVCVSSLLAQSSKNQIMVYDFGAAVLAVSDSSKVSEKVLPQDDQPGVSDNDFANKTKINAAWRSLIIPGWGQHYQEKPVQTLLYPTLAFAGVVGSIFTIDQYNTAVDDYNNARNSYLNAFDSGDIKLLRKNMDDKYDVVQSKEKTRDVFLIATGAAWLWNVLDTVILPPGYENKMKVSTSSKNDKVLIGMNISL